MLCVKPTTDEQLKKEIFSAHGINSDLAQLLVAVENDKILGYTAVEPYMGKLTLYALSLTDCSDLNNMDGESREIAEYLIRAAGNYAYNRLLTALVCEDMSLKPVLSLFGFKEIDNKLSLDIKLLFKRCENCGSSQ